MRKRKRNKILYRLLIGLSLAMVIMAAAIIVLNPKEGEGGFKGALQNAATGMLQHEGSSIPSESMVSPEIYEGKYAYGKLRAAEQLVYAELLTIIYDHRENVTISTSDAEVLEHAYNAVTADFGDLFWIYGYSWTISRLPGASIKFTPTYTMDNEERDQYEEQIETAIGEWLQGFDPFSSDFEKARFVYESLARNVDYDEQSEQNQNIISTFLNRSTVCQGYAEAAVCLFDRLGIQSCVVTGEAYDGSYGGAHAWVLVRLDGEYYYMDPTWGDAAVLSGDEGEEAFVDYRWMNLTTEEMAETHTPDDAIPLPICRAVEDNYYRHEGLYFDTWDQAAAMEAVRREWDRGSTSISLRFSSMEAYAAARTYFVEANGVYATLPEAISFRYSENLRWRWRVFTLFPERGAAPVEEGMEI